MTKKTKMNPAFALAIPVCMMVAGAFGGNAIDKYLAKKNIDIGAAVQRTVGGKKALKTSELFTALGFIAGGIGGGHVGLKVLKGIAAHNLEEHNDEVLIQ